MTCKAHGTRHYASTRCKRRDCEECGPYGRWRIAERISWGVRELWPCAWLTLTLRGDLTKAQVVRKVGTFVRWLRTRNSRLQYAATYELTEAGRLHVNLIAGPWEYLPQPELERSWGSRVWVCWVKDERSMGREAAKSYSARSLAGYLAKLDQAVPEDRRVSYSKGWPKVEKVETKGELVYERLTLEEVASLEWAIQHGLLELVGPGEYASRGQRCEHPECDCFQPRLPMPRDGPGSQGEPR